MGHEKLSVFSRQKRMILETGPDARSMLGQVRIAPDDPVGRSLLYLWQLCLVLAGAFASRVHENK